MRSKDEKGREGQDRGKKRAERGMVMLMALVLMSGLIFISGTSSLRSTRQTQTAAVDLDHTRAFYAAEAAIEEGADDLRSLLDNAVDPTADQLEALNPPSIEGYEFGEFTVVKNGPINQEFLTTGDYQGLIGFVQRYDITVQASSGRRSSEIRREMQHQFIPLFQFGVFYENDLEIFPGPAMTFSGAIHTNANLYMGAGTSIACVSSVTAVGNYFHYRKESGVDEPGPVTVTDLMGTPQNVWRGAYWLDERRLTWSSEALALWQGNFRDRAHGLSTLRLPLPPATDQHMIIERPAGGDGDVERDTKYWYKSTVRYLDGAITDSAGHPLVMPGVFSYMQNQFWDGRESRWVDVLNVDIGVMRTGGYSPPNGIMYVSNNAGDRSVVRIRNAGTLPNGGLTIVSDRPVYVQGHYNNVSKKGSAIMCDAIILLSPNWNDANSSLPLANRVPTALTVNCCVMAGHVATSGSSYSGGLENSFRFLENWNGVQVTYRGSIIHLWRSRINTAAWTGTGGYYNAPKRNWGFDTDLLEPGNWPPGTPRVQTVQRGSWRQIS